MDPTPLRGNLERWRKLGSPGPFTQVVGAALNKFIIIDMFAKVAQGTAPKDAIAFAVNEYNVLLKGQ